MTSPQNIENKYAILHLNPGRDILFFSLFICSSRSTQGELLLSNFSFFYENDYQDYEN